MKHLAAFLLLGLGGNTSPSGEDIKNVLSAVGIEADEDRLSKMLSELEGKDVSGLISQGAQRLASVPSGGGGGGAAAAPAAAGAAAGADAPKAEEKKVEEEKEDTDDDMGFGLFDD